MAGEAGASIGALARGIVLDPTTLTRNIRPLEKAGLLRVARSPQDKRTRMVFLTRSGERMIERVFPAWQRALGEANAAFGERRIGEVRVQLGRIVAMVDGFVGRTRPSERPEASAMGYADRSLRSLRDRG